MGETRVLVCGYGIFGRLHAAAWREVAGVRLMVADPAGASRERALAEGVAAGDIAATAADLIARADIVDVVAPPDEHLPLVLAALAAGRPVLLEKPAVRSVADAQLLAARLGNVPLQVGHVLRAHPLTRRATAILRAGGIGRLVAMEGDFRGWKRMRADSSVIENDGVHFLDLMRHFAGAPAAAVDARAMHRLGGARADDIRIDLAYPGGVAGELRLGVVAGGETEDPFLPGAVTDKRLRLVGDGGVLVIDFNRNRLTHGTARYDASPGGWTPTVTSLTEEQVLGATPVRLLADSFRVFLDAIAGRGAVLCDAQEGAVEMAGLLTAIDRALAQPATPFIPVRENAA
ncbi:Gfo/Idh/MocA family protein [Acuticoccus sediminis]|uniref:Gfo/Idh/MocA family protein n=1 Tax=Acuticoccus sediminis TaxID=2184697 RepID=UPI001CFE1C4E|nr:Gfo/Idh/MocA family oxidoreductase [Acuticoccus sediminis]